ncbi:hypothetical protein ACFX13_038025 [Malus domestica]
MLDFHCFLYILILCIPKAAVFTVVTATKFDFSTLTLSSLKLIGDALNIFWKDGVHLASNHVFFSTMATEKGHYHRCHGSGMDGRDHPFDACCLCLKPFIDPMCCQKSHIFCKEYILECLLSQKKDIHSDRFFQI